ncbi:MAG: penicillin acylase family protein [Acidimicrobiia bacterium]
MTDTGTEATPRKKRRVLRRILWSLLAFGVGLVIAAIVFLQYSVHRAFPQTTGTVEIPGLTDTVEVIRDSFGVPHIYASTPHDLMLAQGYVHAQDRFFQMDFWRHISHGELASMFGESQLETDMFLRDMGWGRLATAQYEAETEAIRALLDAYAQGVNAYLETQSPADLSFEYTILELLNHEYDPEPWDGADSLAWGKVMAWDLGGNKSAEIERAMYLGVLSSDRVDQLFPPYPGDRHPYIVPRGQEVPTGVQVQSQIPDGARSPLSAASRAIRAINQITLGGEGTGIGSNSWVVAGAHTPTGLPYLANDPHLGAQMPSIWYQVGLHCYAVTPDCPFDVAGFSFAGVPGVIIGHNANIAWGFTNTGPDVQDLYIEKINPDNPDQYEVNGAWVDMEIRTETIEVAGGEPTTKVVRSTRHGPIISDSYEPLEDFDASGAFKPDPYAIALRWTALDPSPSIAGPILGLNTASSFDEFRAAAELFDVPAQNMIYADVAGNIGYQMPGKVPIRASGDGTLPVPGWTDAFEWTGFVPFDELPSSYNPPSGWIVTANNAVVDDTYGFLITKDFDDGYRARRIVDLVASNLGIDAEGHRVIQFDSYDLNAAFILPYLENALVVEPDAPSDETATAAINELFTWDLRNTATSAGAAVWNGFWRNLLDLTFRGDLPSDWLPEGNARWFEVMRGLLVVPDDPFWDDPTTGAVEDRDAILVAAFGAALDELSSLLRGNPWEWTWGDLHTMTFVNQSLGDSGIGIIEDRFNRGPYPASGSEGVVNAVGWTATEGYAVDWLPSMRMLIDLSDLSASTAIHTTGQSGHTDHPHYDDMIALWLVGDTAPMLWNRADIDEDAEARMVLSPR